MCIYWLAETHDSKMKKNANDTLENQTFSPWPHYKLINLKPSDELS